MPTFLYSANGQRVPSVTGVIRLLGENKQALVHSAWKLGMEGKNYRDEWGKAASAGTAAHAMAEAQMTKPPDEASVAIQAILGALPPEEAEGAKSRFDSFCAWLQQHKYQPVASEVSMVSEVHLYGGTIDAVGLINNEPALIDLKSKTLYKDQIIQVAAYRQLWDETHPDMPIRSVHILGMSEGFHHHMIPLKTVDKAFYAFSKLRDLERLLKEIKS